MEVCKHTKYSEGYWLEEWDHENEELIDSYYVPGEDVHTYKDIDVHRYYCTQCSEVFYYSETARLHYEEGIESPLITANSVLSSMVRRIKPGLISANLVGIQPMSAPLGTLFPITKKITI